MTPTAGSVSGGITRVKRDGRFGQPVQTTFCWA